MQSLFFRLVLAICIGLFFLLWFLSFNKVELKWEPFSLNKNDADDDADDAKDKDKDNAAKKEGNPLITPSKTKNERTDTIIPLNIFQTWYSKTDMPPNMKVTVEYLKSQNPEFTHYLFDDDDCRAFIAAHFDKDVVHAFDCLNPGAYKADLWRYCVLYVHGGVYLDIKFCPINDFHFIDIMDQEHFTLDRHVGIYSATMMSYEVEQRDVEFVQDLSTYHQRVLSLANHGQDQSKQKQKQKKQWFWEDDQTGLYNAIMICKPKNTVLHDCIRAIVQNVNDKFYGFNCLYPTGPGLLSKMYFKGDMNKIVEDNFDLFHGIYSTDIVCRRLKKYILRWYPGYREDQTKYNNGKPHYGILWIKRTVYRELPEPEKTEKENKMD